MRKISLVLLAFAIPNPLFAQHDHIGSGRAIEFDGIDDYIDLGNIYDNLQLPITVSAWVYLGASTQSVFPILVSEDNASLYNGFWFCVTKTNLFIEYGDGRGDQNPMFRRGKSALINNIQNRWVCVSAVLNNASDIQLYVNGFNAGGTYTGNSDQDMASDYPADVAKIGYFFQNAAIHRFVGRMDELRIWNRALTEDELRESMCLRLTANETGLIGYWNFDELSGDLLEDQSPEGYNGVLNGNPKRVFSGAPIGDESIFLYSDNWTGKSLSTDTVSVSGISGNPYGVYLYEVNGIPSQTGGLDVSGILSPYFGVFLADDGNDNVFDLTFGDNMVCNSFQRKDNSEDTWYPSEIFSAIHGRTEIIPSFETANLNVDLGDDMFLCNRSSFVLSVKTDTTGKTFSWNTGETSPELTVTTPGMYSVEVKQHCLMDRDTILVTFVTSPPAFSLGEDEILCSFEPRILTSDVKMTNGLDFTWQDGSKNQSFQVGDFGTYWLKIQNVCGASTDSITFTRQILKNFKSYNFISPDNDDDFNQYFTVDDLLVGAQLSVFNRWGKEVYQSSSYHNNWDGKGLPSGVYFYTIHGPCIQPQKGTLTIMR